MLGARSFVTLERCAGSGDRGFTLLGLWVRVRNMENLVCEDVWKGQPGVLVREVRMRINAAALEALDREALAVGASHLPQTF